MEIMMIAGRKKETKKQLIKQLFQQTEQHGGISINDVEICILESPETHWDFGGTTGDELPTNYPLNF